MSPASRIRFLLAASALLLSGCGSREATVPPPAARSPVAADGAVVIPAGSPKLEHIHVDTVKMQEIPEAQVVSPGKIEANPNRVSRVVLPVTGRVTSVLVRLGDSVKKGDPLLTIESPDADAGESAYLQAQAALTQARANQVKAQADYDRANDLLSHDAVAKKEVLSAENALAQAKAAVEQAQAAQEQAARRLGILGLKAGRFGQQVVVPAPLSGKVLEISVTAGEFRNDTNSAVMTIADLSTVWVSSDVPESSIRLIQTGEPIDVTLTAYPSEVFRARVTRIADTVDPQTRTVKVRAELENRQGRFRPEMFGTIRHIESTKKVPVLPIGAVLHGDGRDLVYVEQGAGRFLPQTVVVGSRVGDVLPVLQGVKTGDRVVVDGTMLLQAQ
ncbi:MAG TPA: efflux RND transporter periplasmic adaptor subunit [Bryobacteraceae bacterium]|jgi:cobalt-zinc-cadmium efflux system membrane fusion protein|nr:efflux RND transporter periplasmic adaptor subunit [Bryobacteraceae bacterium]